MKDRYLFDNNYVREPKKLRDLFLYQLGEKLCGENPASASHRHGDLFEFTFVFSGKGKSYANGIPSEIGPDDLYLSIPGEEHSIETDAETPMRFFFCAFRFSAESPIYPMLCNDFFLHLDERSRVLNLPQYSDTFRKLLTEIDVRDELSECLLEYELKALILHVLQQFNPKKPNRYSPPEESRAGLLCFRINRYIDAHLTDIGNLSELSEVFGYHYSYLSRVYRKTTGVSIVSYYTGQKLERAKKLLLSGDGVTAVAEKLGYTSAFVFSRAFKAKYGISPTEFRTEKKTSGDGTGTGEKSQKM